MTYEYDDIVSPEVWSLIEAVCNGTIDDAQMDDLQARLRADARLREFYVDFLNLHAELQRIIGTQEQGEAAARQFIGADVPARRSPVLGFLGSACHGTVSYFSQIGPLSYLIATFIMLGMGVVAWQWRLPDGNCPNSCISENGTVPFD